MKNRKSYFFIQLSMHVKHLQMNIECSSNTLFFSDVTRLLSHFDFEYKHKLHLRRLNLELVGSYSWIFLRFAVGSGSFEELGSAT